MTILILGFLTVLIPIGLVLWFIYSSGRGRLEWVIKLLLVGSITLLFFQIGPWAITSYYFRYIVMALFLGGMVYSYFRNRNTPESTNVWLRTLLLKMTLLVAVLGLNGLAVLGKLRPSDTVTLTFPLKNGTYYILQGGVTWIVNPFHSIFPSGKYALDVVQLGRFGNRAASLVPSQLGQYHVYGANVYSPCDGRVQESVGSLMDNEPPNVDWENPGGNHLVLACNGIEVTLMHMKKDSLKVTTGDHVMQGQLIGIVGNSGYSDEPHLHVQANTPDGRPLPMVFDAKFLSINDRYFN